MSFPDGDIGTSQAIPYFGKSRQEDLVSPGSRKGRQKFVFYFVLLIAIIYTFLLCFTEPGVEVGTCVLKTRAISLKETFCILMFLEFLFLPKMTTEKDRYIPVNLIPIDRKELADQKAA